MKKLISLTFVLLFALSMIPSRVEAKTNFGKWKSETRDCTVTITIGGGPLPFSISETYHGTKRICVDGTGWCFWNGDCE